MPVVVHAKRDEGESLFSNIPEICLAGLSDENVGYSLSAVPPMKKIRG